jgi:hypothetical protein
MFLLTFCDVTDVSTYHQSYWWIRAADSIHHSFLHSPPRLDKAEVFTWSMKRFQRDIEKNKQIALTQFFFRPNFSPSSSHLLIWSFCSFFVDYPGLPRDIMSSEFVVAIPLLWCFFSPMIFNILKLTLELSNLQCSIFYLTKSSWDIKERYFYCRWWIADLFEKEEEEKWQSKKKTQNDYLYLPSVANTHWNHYQKPLDQLSSQLDPSYLFY